MLYVVIIVIEQTKKKKYPQQSQLYMFILINTENIS